MKKLSQSKKEIHLEFFGPCPVGIGIYYKGASHRFEIMTNRWETTPRYKLCIYAFGWARAFGDYDDGAKHLRRLKDGATIGSLLRQKLRRA